MLKCETNALVIDNDAITEKRECGRVGVHNGEKKAVVRELIIIFMGKLCKGLPSTCDSYDKTDHLLKLIKT